MPTLDRRLRKFVTEIYQLNDTRKCEQVSMILSKYAGQERKLCKILVKKYKLKKRDIPQYIRNLMAPRGLVINNISERNHLAGEIEHKNKETRRRRSMSPMPYKKGPIFSPISQITRETSRSRPRVWDDVLEQPRNSRMRSVSGSKTPKKTKKKLKVNFSNDDIQSEIVSTGDLQLDNIVFGPKFSRLKQLCLQHGVSLKRKSRDGSDMILTGNKKGVSAVQANIKTWKDILEDAQEYLTSASPDRALSRRAG